MSGSKVTSGNMFSFNVKKLEFRQCEIVNFYVGESVMDGVT